MHVARFVQQHWASNTDGFDSPSEQVLARNETVRPRQDGEFFLGSKEFARVYAEASETRRGGPRYVAGLVLEGFGTAAFALGARRPITRARSST